MPRPAGSNDIAAVMTERRYSEEEVAAVFERATEAQQTARRQLPPGEGLTLADLQEIGREVGIPPELVAQAARSMDQGRRPASRTFLGLPIGVGRTIDLDRRLSVRDNGPQAVKLSITPEVSCLNSKSTT